MNYNMIIYFRDILDEEFISKFIPQIIISKALWLSKRMNTQKMNEYLKSQFNLSIEEILKQLKFSTNHYNDTYSLRVDNNAYEEKSQEKLISLIKLIDYGNLDVRGLNIINLAIAYVSKNIKGLYKYYQMKGGSYVS